MRFLIPVVLLTGLFVLASGAVPGSATSAAAANTRTDVQLSSTEGRIGGGLVTTQPEWFGSKWWKKFKKAMIRFLEFLDALIDDLRDSGDEPGTGGQPVTQNIGASTSLPDAAIPVRQLIV